MQTSSHRGFFLTFEGPDGSGKTTQLRLLADWLRGRGVDPVLLRQPGGTALGESLRSVLLSSRARTADNAHANPAVDPAAAAAGIAPLAELALMFADRAQSIAEVILPALASGRVLLCDRYTDSSEAYQGGGRGLGTARVLALHRDLCDGLQPDLTVLLLPDPEIAWQRATRRNSAQQQISGVDENRFEAEGRAFSLRVHEGYRAIAAREPERVSIIDGDGDIESVAGRVRAVVAARLRSHGQGV